MLHCLLQCVGYTALVCVNLFITVCNSVCVIVL